MRTRDCGVRARPTLGGTPARRPPACRRACGVRATGLLRHARRRGARRSQALHDAGHEVALVVTQPDRRRGRGDRPRPSPVKEAAEALGLPVRTPDRSREVVDEVAASGAELGVVVAFGQLLPQALLDALPRGFVNVHFSLLPRWRGAAPVERAMLAGDAETGVCIMALEAGLDTGPVYARAARAIGSARDRGRAARPAGRRGHRAAGRRRSRRSPTTTPEPQVGRADLRRQAHGRGVRARLDAARGRPRPHRARRQPAPRCVDHRPRHPPEDLAGASAVGRHRRRRRAPCSAHPASRPATARSSWSRCNPRAAG